MLGPYYKRSKQVFTQEVDGSPERTHIILMDPSGTQTEHETTYNPTTGLWETGEIGLNTAGWWNKFATVWRDADTTTPVTTDWEMFLVYGHPTADLTQEP